MRGASALPADRQAEVAQFCDVPGDPHSPVTHSIAHAHVLWLTERENFAVRAELVRGRQSGSPGLIRIFRNARRSVRRSVRVLSSGAGLAGLLAGATDRRAFLHRHLLRLYVGFILQ